MAEIDKKEKHSIFGKYRTTAKSRANGMLRQSDIHEFNDVVVLVDELKDEWRGKHGTVSLGSSMTILFFVLGGYRPARLATKCLRPSSL